MFRILAVCSRNICRSPLIEAEIGSYTSQGTLATVPIEVRSAGIEALGGEPSCRLGAEEIGLVNTAHLSQPLTLEMARGADLILTAERGHGGAVIALEPASRQRCFNLTSASRLAKWVAEPETLRFAVSRRSGASPDRALGPVGLIEPLPTKGEARLRWMVTEMHHNRGVVSGSTFASRRTPDDIPDPHVLGSHLHSSTAQLIADSVADLATAMAAVLGVSAPPSP